MSAAKEPGFTESAESLDNILDKFRNEDMSLEESLSLFEEGVKNLRRCQKSLTEAKGKVESLLDVLREEGEAVTELAESMDDFEE